MLYVRILALSAFTLSKQNALAFTPGIHLYPTSNIKAVPNDVDLSIEYDAAAKIAYNQWREEYEKGDFDEDRYQSFKDNYEALTIMNVIGAKKARETGKVSKRRELNEYADLSTEEYMASKESKRNDVVESNKAIDANPSSSVLETAMESSVAQKAASSAIEEAAAALAKEEQMLAEKLGLNSIEELEAAIDSLDGIAEDGGEI